MIPKEEMERLKILKVAKIRVQKSLLDHTCYFYRKMHQTPFIVNSHHEIVTDALDAVLQGRIKKLIINIAPRYSKTELAVKNFISKGFALNPKANFIHLSYSNDLALDNSAKTRDIVESDAYQEMFPNVKVAARANKKWTTTAGGAMYATATGGQVTGFGAGRVDKDTELWDSEFDEELTHEMDAMFAASGINTAFAGALILDDPIKPEDADSEAKRERVNGRYSSTLKNRVNSRNTPIIIMMQRVHEYDLCGYLLENEPGEWTVISLPSLQDEGLETEHALWPFKHTREELLKLRDEDPVVFGRQHQQDPKPKGGRLYQREWKTYEGLDYLPYMDWSMRKMYVDTADTGSDFMCSISYLESTTALYVLDVIYTQSPIESTEPLLIRQAQNVEHALFESNNGGRGQALNVEKGLRLQGNYSTIIDWFFQGQNKESRIFAQSNAAQNLILFPVGWEKMWPKFHKHVTEYMATGKNAQDGGPDVLSGMVENFGKYNSSSAEMLASMIP